MESDDGRRIFHFWSRRAENNEQSKHTHVAEQKTFMSPEMLFFNMVNSKVRMT